MIINFLLIIVGFVLLIKGADFLVDGASNIAKKFNIPGIVIGLTIVSIGTSMPELFVSITSALNGYSDMAIGNVVGSNISNLFLILGLTAAITPIPFKKSTIKYELKFCLFSTILLFIVSNSDNKITRIESLILLINFILFIIYTIILAKRSRKKMEVEEKSDTKFITDIVFMIIGILGLKFGGDLTVNNSVKIAEIFGLSEKIISVTILAIGTSLPELVTSIAAAKKGETDLAIGNIIGSNIFNFLLIIGISSMITPITYNVSYNRDLIILFVAVILLYVFSFTKPKEKMSRTNGILYFICYIIYIILLIFN